VGQKSLHRSLQNGHTTSVGRKPLQKHQKVIKVLKKHQKVYPTKNKKAKVYESCPNKIKL